MTFAQVVETSVTNNSSFQNYTHPDDHTIRTTDTPGFKGLRFFVKTKCLKLISCLSILFIIWLSALVLQVHNRPVGIECATIIGNTCKHAFH